MVWKSGNYHNRCEVYTKEYNFANRLKSGSENKIFRLPLQNRKSGGVGVNKITLAIKNNWNQGLNKITLAVNYVRHLGVNKITLAVNYIWNRGFCTSTCIVCSRHRSTARFLLARCYSRKVPEVAAVSPGGYAQNRCGTDITGDSFASHPQNRSENSICPCLFSVGYHILMPASLASLDYCSNRGNFGAFYLYRHCCFSDSVHHLRM